MASSSSAALRIPTPTHHPAAGTRPPPTRAAFVSVRARSRRPVVSVSASLPKQTPPGTDDDADGSTGVPAPLPPSRDTAIALPRKPSIFLSVPSRDNLFSAASFADVTVRLCVCVNAGPLTSADLMGEASGHGLKVAYQVCFFHFFFFRETR
jgi:hypothetical protein